MRGRTATTTLVKGHDTVQRRVEEAPAQGIATGARTTMHEQHRQAIGRTTLVHIQDMRLLHGQGMTRIGFDFRIQALHGLLLIGLAARQASADSRQIR